jgi:hypothetical protein
MAKFKRALAAAGQLQDVIDYIIANYNTGSAESLELTDGVFVQPNGVFWSVTKLATGNTLAQMSALMLAAATLPG